MFIGTLQSRYAGIAIAIAILTVCLCILFANTNITLSNRLLIVFFVVLSCLPSILLSLFELSCMVTGGTKKTNSGCYWFAWFISGLMILYSIIVIIYAIYILFTYDHAQSKVQEYEESKNMQMSNEEANDIAVKMMTNEETVETPQQSEELKQPMMDETIDTFTPNTLPEKGEMSLDMMQESSVPNHDVNHGLNNGEVIGMDYSDMYSTV